MNKLINQLDKKAVIVIFLVLSIFFVGGSAVDVESGEDLVALAFLISGPLFYILISAFYSGKDKRHFHERETENIVRNLRQDDKFIKTVTKTRESSIGSITYSNQVDIGGAIASKIIKEGKNFLS